MQLIVSEEYMKEALEKFLVYNKASASQGIIWDTLKAHLRGLNST